MNNTDAMAIERVNIDIDLIEVAPDVTLAATVEGVEGDEM